MWMNKKINYCCVLFCHQPTFLSLLISISIKLKIVVHLILTFKIFISVGVFIVQMVLYSKFPFWSSSLILLTYFFQYVLTVAITSSTKFHFAWTIKRRLMQLASRENYWKQVWCGLRMVKKKEFRFATFLWVPMVRILFVCFCL